ncbi:MAG: helix-turn-helix domain-containing protein [Oscillospiraceae bacterium]|nr:helix-turn-helix domain-containing protein [Oscillospiraceae bacterium]
MKNRPLIGIITARVANPEQKQLLHGILHQADKLGIDTVIFSNIYNFDKYYANTEVENRIYDLIESGRIDGLILTAESILNPELQQNIYERIQHRDAPVVVTGAVIPGLLCINNDVADDFEEITRHALEKDQFTNIDFLTGPKHIDTSLLRVAGCRRTLEQYGLSLPEENIIYGDFWLNSGMKLAEEYIAGKRPLPDVVICANDYMAYGLIDTLLPSPIRVPEDVSVIGYEFVGERYYHSPILSTYLRNRYACGQKAVEMLYSKISDHVPEDITLTGMMICGNSCPCGADAFYLDQELSDIRRAQEYLQLNFESNFEQQLTVCRSINDYIHVLQEFSYLVRDCVGIYMCLYESWYSDTPVLDEDAPMLCYRIISPGEGTDIPQPFRRKSLFPPQLPGSTAKTRLYFAPIFFAGRELGYFIIQYDKPDTYDKSFGDWLKIAANGLEGLRMKNDIRTLLECRNLSEHHDTATGLLNSTGFRNEAGLALQEAKPDDRMLLLLVRTSLFTDDTSIDSRSTSVRLEAQVVDCLRKVSANGCTFLAKLEERLFAICSVGRYTQEDGEQLVDKLTTLILHTPLYKEHREVDSLCCEFLCIPAKDAVVTSELQQLRECIQKKQQYLTTLHSHISFPAYAALRQSIFRDPQNEWDAMEACRKLHLSYGHFRATYKELFGISFHQDLIRCRISLAKHLLLTTSLSLQNIAYRCGYEDDKYFLRQFRKLTGMTPNQYRNA